MTQLPPIRNTMPARHVVAERYSLFSEVALPPPLMALWYVLLILDSMQHCPIFTGTPAGVGKAHGIQLQPGNVLTSTIEGIGSIRNTVINQPTMI